MGSGTSSTWDPSSLPLVQACVKLFWAKKVQKVKVLEQIM